MTNRTEYNSRILVVGATGHVGSQIVKALLRRGWPVRALVRKHDAVIHGAEGNLDYAVGDLRDKESLERALQDIDIVVSTANSIIPAGKTLSVKSISEDGYENLISACEAAGVRQFVQSSVPTYKGDKTIPELAGKRVVETRLTRSPIATTIVRNPAFTDVWMVMTGAKQAMGNDPHATTRRPFGFMKLWQNLTGNLVVKHGFLLAPGGKKHGAPLITTRDVAEMMVGTVGRQDAFNRIIEAGGPEWLTWGDVAELLSQKTGRKVRTLTMPGWFAALGQVMLQPFMPSAGNVLGLVKLVASYQPHWENPPVVAEFDLPVQMTVSDYLDKNWQAT
ncbi:MAG: SDR family oxidoreductase [Phormidesmis sp.]